MTQAVTHCIQTFFVSPWNRDATTDIDTDIVSDTKAAIDTDITTTHTVEEFKSIA